jgi:hypothetical protein
MDSVENGQPLPSLIPTKFSKFSNSKNEYLKILFHYICGSGTLVEEWIVNMKVSGSNLAGWFFFIDNYLIQMCLLSTLAQYIYSVIQVNKI